MNHNRRSLSIQTKVTLFVVLTLGMLSVLMAVISFQSSLERVNDIERDQADAAAERVQRQLANSLTDIAGTTTDWAWWDDTFEFVQNGNAEYADGNLYADAFVPIGVSLVAFVDAEGTIVHDAWYVEADELPVPDVVLDVARPGGTLDSFDDDLEATKGGIVTTDDAVFLVSSRSILRSDRTGEGVGHLVMGRLIDDQFTSELAELTGLDLTLERCGDAPCAGLSTTPTISTTADTITTATAIESLDGQPVLRLDVAEPRTMYQESRAGIDRMLIILIGVGALAILVTIAGIRRLVVHPIERLGTTVDEVARSTDPSLRAETARTDEIGALAGGVNVMLARLQHSQDQLREANDQLQSASTAKSRFLSHVSHELRTPINGVLAYAQLLQLDGLEPEANDSVEQIITSARHITTLVDEFLDIARIEAGSIPINIESVEAREIANQVIAMTQPLAATESTRVDLRADDDAIVLADQLRLRQVLLNLVSNAIKYGDQTPVEISVQSADSCIEFTVRDHGQGIPADQLHRLFTPFDRLGADDSNKQGTGLGLSVTKQLVELMDGSIDVSSEPGTGTAFTVTLPQAAAPSQVAHDATVNEPVGG